MEKELLLLKEDYERKLTTIKTEIDANLGKMKLQRLQAKYSCYKTFISELNRIIINI